MATTSLSLSCSILSPKPPQNPTRYPIGPKRIHLRLRKNQTSARSASKRDGYGYGYGYGHGHDYGGGLVDENMMVLRRRIEELRAAERMDPDPQESWTEWEKDYYESCYGSDVCQAVGLIQMFAMSVRPGVSLGLVGLILLSAPMSVVLLGLHLGQALKILLVN